MINTAGGGSYGHLDSPAAGAISLRQAYECWKAGADPVEWATTHREFARAFESFPAMLIRCIPGGAQRLGVQPVIRRGSDAMPTGGRSTLTQFLIEERRRAPGATGELNALITDVALACKAIATRGATAHSASAVGSTGVASTCRVRSSSKLDVAEQRLFLRATEWGGHVAGMVSEELEESYRIPDRLSARQVPAAVRSARWLVEHRCERVGGQHLLGAAGADTRGRTPTLVDFLQPGTEQVCAGYAIYGPCTMLVLTLGKGTHAFTLDPSSASGC